MNSVFEDASGFYAVLDRDDADHARAPAAWEQLLRKETLLTHNYALLETAALLQYRFGLTALRAFSSDILPLLQIEWVTQQRHKAAMEAVLAVSRRNRQTHPPV